MRITIVRDDSVVRVDGIFRRINLSAMTAGIRAVQWNGVNGHIEYDDASNTPLQSIADFQQFIVPGAPLLLNPLLQPHYPSRKPPRSIVSIARIKQPSLQ